MLEKDTAQSDADKEMRLMGSTLGGVLLCGSLFGPVGAIIGAGIGYVLGNAVNEEEGNNNNANS